MLDTRREPIKETATNVTTTCRSCGGIFTYKKSQENTYKGAGQFCSRECATLGSLEVCQQCSKQYRAYNGIGKFCSKQCQRRAEVNTPLNSKVRAISANIVLGKGKKELIRNLIESALDSQCLYCGVVLTLDNLSLDHKVAIAGATSRRQKANNYLIRRELDRPENLQIICKDCNFRKSDFDHEEYMALLSFLKQHPNIQTKLYRRLAQARFMWGSKKR